MSVGGTRPRNLKLMSIRLPVPALVSILHRASGFLLFLALPFLLLALQRSLHSQEQFEQILRVFQHPVLKLLLWVSLVVFTHHFLAGIRHLAMDAHMGTRLAEARLTGKLILLLDVILSVMVVCWLW